MLTQSKQKTQQGLTSFPWLAEEIKVLECSLNVLSYLLFIAALIFFLKKFLVKLFRSQMIELQISSILYQSDPL